MKKIIFVLCVLTLCIFAFGCGKEEKEGLAAIEFKSIEKMCKLSCTEFCFNDTTVITKEKGTGLLHIFDEKMKVFIEFSGKINMGIDFNKVSFEVEGADTETPVVNITLPKPEILSRTDVEFKDPISSEGGFLNNNYITDEDIRNEVAVASQKIIDTMKDDSYYQQITIDRAELLIENYITSFGEAAGRTCTINWTVEE